MESIPDFLKNNDHYLKSCILYEAAQKKPIFDAYRSFCDTVGQDAMQYRDFERWYHRFCLGELDFDYDRSKDPVQKAIMDMAVKFVRKVTENLDPFERSFLPSTNHGIKELTDSLPPFFKKITITISDEEMAWQLNDMQFISKKYGTSCKPTNYNKDYIEEGLEYLTPIFKMPKLHVNYLSLEKMSPDKENPFKQF